MFNIVFRKYICIKCEWLTILTESIPSTRQSARPLAIPLSPQKRVYIPVSVQYASSPQATQMLLIFSAASLCLFYEGSARAGRLFGFRKEKAPQLPKLMVVEKQWHTLCDSHCSLNLFLLAVIPGSFYLSHHGCLVQLVVSALAWEHWDNLTNMVGASCQREREERGCERNALIAARI